MTDNNTTEFIHYAERFQKAITLTNRKISLSIEKQLEDGLTGPQCYILKMIHDEERATASFLSEQLEVKPSAVTVMVDRLEQNGFVARLPDADDRRVMRLVLTDKGKQALYDVRQQYQSILTALIAELNDEERKSFIHHFEIIASAAAKLD